MSLEIRPFKVTFEEDKVNRLHDKLRDTRHPTNDVVPGSGQDYGLPTQWGIDLYSYWLQDYSWGKAQQHINSFPQFITEIEGLKIHFIHQRASDPAAIPILLLHGWPGSFYEFSEIIEPLSSPSGEQQSFHCVAPSLPGFCFSDPPPRRGWTMKDTARIMHRLMQRLGYEQYVCQAGDWGQFVARELGAQHSESCKVIHLNYCPGALPDDLSDGDITDRERRVRDKGQDWRTTHVGYAVLMRTRPQTVRWMLNDNPVGLLAFVGEKYEEAANPKMQSEKKWKDHILTTICFYYFTNCIMTSALPYYENGRHDQFAAEAMKPENFIKSPFGYTSCWYDTAPNSKRAVERTGNLVFYKERDDTGHFACLENPEGIAEDVRTVVAQHWSRQSRE